MEFQRQIIRQKLIENGWKIIELEKASLDWWANEMWQIESVWSPIGKIAFVTFLLEPENMSHVWKITVSDEKLTDQFGNQNSFSMTLKNWEGQLSEFINFLSGLRHQKNQ